jgi:hypothetical protein
VLHIYVSFISVLLPYSIEGLLHLLIIVIIIMMIIIIELYFL